VTELFVLVKNERRKARWNNADFGKRGKEKENGEVMLGGKGTKKDESAGVLQHHWIE
jgi:hypothetical protein